MGTFIPSASSIERQWHVIDAEGQVLGRVATLAARLLQGKHKGIYTPFIDTGDHVVIINADKVAMTGRKLTRKLYHRHTGHPGGIKTTTPAKILASKFPERVLELAIKRMMPGESPLARDQFSKLRVYAGSDHPHGAQNPETVDFKSMNSKNSKVA